MAVLTAGEMFAGYGGLAMAVHDAFTAQGHTVQTKWLAEFDDAPSRILAHRYPGVPNLGDVTAVDWSDPAYRVDIIAGGSPCQDVSAAGRRAGMTEGTRSNLWVAQREAVNIIRPQWAVWENVRGAFSAQAHSELEPCEGCVGGREGRDEPVLRALGRVLGDFSGLGYDTQWRGLRAADVGAPHGRYRVFVLARRRD